MPLIAYLPESILHQGAVLRDFALLAEDGRVRAVLPVKDVPGNAEKVKLDGLTLAPGLIDLQVNGGGGVLFNSAPEKLDSLVAAHRAMGTVGLLPTLISDDIKKIPQAVEAIRTYKKDGVAGIHFEGPFLNEARKGVHPATALRHGAMDVFENLNMAGLGRVLITLAPEMVPEGAIKKLCAKGAVICAGHSMADAPTLHRARAEGLKGVTHLYNGMGGMSARAPGLAGLALSDDALACGLICDDAHVDAAMIRLAIKAKPAGQLFLVSDAMPPAAQNPPQDFDLLGEKISVRNGRCETQGGNLAGCALTLFECVKIAVKKIGVPLETAIAMASLYPARMIGIEKDYGSFSPGTRAAMIAFDKDMKLEKVIF